MISLILFDSRTINIQTAAGLAKSVEDLSPEREVVGLILGTGTVPRVLFAFCLAHS